MARLRGRSLRGQRLLSKVPFGHWKTQTFIAGLRCDALTAPFVIDAPMDRRIFETYVETQLAPTLRPGDVVVLDNLPAHKSAAAEQAVRAMGAWLLFLPPYSPDLNPIEMAFAKLKALLRARAVRTIDDADRGGAADLSQRPRSWRRDLWRADEIVDVRHMRLPSSPTQAASTLLAP